MKLVVTKSNDPYVLKKGAEQVGITPRQLEALAAQFGDRGLGSIFSQAAVLLAGQSPAPPTSTTRSGALPSAADLDKAAGAKKTAEAQASTRHAEDVGRALVGWAVKHADYDVAAGRVEFTMHLTGMHVPREDTPTTERTLREGLARELPGVEIGKIKVRTVEHPETSDGPGSAWVEASVDAKVVDPARVQKAATAREGWVAATADAVGDAVASKLDAALARGATLPIKERIGSASHDYSGTGINGALLKLWGTDVELPVEAIDKGFVAAVKERVAGRFAGTDLAVTLSLDTRDAHVHIDRAPKS